MGSHWPTILEKIHASIDGPLGAPPSPASNAVKHPYLIFGRVSKAEGVMLREAPALRGDRECCPTCVDRR